MTAWQLQEAKQRLSEVVRAAEEGGPQTITRHGREVAVVIDMATYRRFAGIEVEFADYLRHGPSFDELDLTRRDDLPRHATDSSDGARL